MNSIDNGMVEDKKNLGKASQWVNQAKGNKPRQGYKILNSGQASLQAFIVNVTSQVR